MTIGSRFGIMLISPIFKLPINNTIRIVISEKASENLSIQALLYYRTTGTTGTAVLILCSPDRFGGMVDASINISE